MIKMIVSPQGLASYQKAAAIMRAFIITGGAQAIVQCTGLITGIMIIRLLPTREYAYYTIANAMLGSMTVLSDSGINNGIMAQGGKVWQNKIQLGQIVSTGLNLRRRFALLSIGFSMPFLVFFLVRQGARWPESLLIAAALIPAFAAAMSDSILEIPSKLHQDIKSLQLNQLVVSAGRLIFNMALLLLLPFTFISLIANGIPRLIGNYKLRQTIPRFADLNQRPDPRVRTEILAIVKRIFPMTIYYAYSGQLLIWLVSLTGSVFTVAQIGALSRITMATNLFSVLFATVVVPRFARLAADRSLLLRRYVQLLALLSLLSLLTVFLGWKFSYQILWILGKEYTNLSEALILSLIGSCVHLVSGAVYGIYSSRGWTIQPFLSIALNVISIIICLYIFETATLNGVLKFNIASALVPLVTCVTFGAFKINSLPKQP